MLKYVPWQSSSEKDDVMSKCRIAFKEWVRTKQCSKSRRQRNMALRRFLRNVHNVYRLDEHGILTSIQICTGLRENEASLIADASQFADRASLLGRRLDGPIPTISSLAAAEEVCRSSNQETADLRATLLQMSRKGRLPSGKKIKEMERGETPIAVNFKILTGSSEIEEQAAQRIVVQTVFHALAKLKKAGSKCAATTLNLLQKRLRILVEQRMEKAPGRIQIALTATVIDFYLKGSHRQTIRAALAAEQSAESRRHNPKRKPSGWYLKYLIKQGLISVAPSSEVTDDSTDLPGDRNHDLLL